jgi:hypothetical protein
MSKHDYVLAHLGDKLQWFPPTCHKYCNVYLVHWSRTSDLSASHQFRRTEIGDIVKRSFGEAAVQHGQTQRPHPGFALSSSGGGPNRPRNLKVGRSTEIEESRKRKRTEKATAWLRTRAFQSTMVVYGPLVHVSTLANVNVIYFNHKYTKPMGTGMRRGQSPPGMRRGGCGKLD